MKKYVFIVPILLVLSVFQLGCPGNSGLDKKAQQDLWTWIQEQETNGWTITGFPGTEEVYKNVILDHRFRPTRLDIVIDSEKMNPFHQRNWIEDIVRKWRNSYPANLTPRFELKVYLYNGSISSANEIGFSIIDKDGRPETHHGKTGDVV